MEQINTEDKEQRQEPVEYLNDTHLVDLEIVEQGKLPEYLKECGYEKIFRIASLKQLTTILEDKEQKETIKKLIKKLGFKKSSCVFHREGNFIIPLEIQKQMLDYQAGLFDDITITFLREQPNDTLQCISYVENKNKDVFVYADLSDTSNSITAVSQIVIDNKRICGMKFKSVRFNKNKDKYTLVADLFKNSEKKLHLVLCNKTIKIFKHENVAFEFIASAYGFKSFCEYFQGQQRKKSSTPKRFILLGFNKDSLCYEKTRGLGYRAQRLRDVGNVANELEICHLRLASDKLGVYAKTKPIFEDILIRLNVIPKTK
jgi:sulfur carrier protein ThiS